VEVSLQICSPTVSRCGGCEVDVIYFLVCAVPGRAVRGTPPESASLFGVCADLRSWRRDPTVM